MKQCPVCSESFPDELRFCDIDGTRLTRRIETGESRGSSRLWSLLGAGLLVGGLVITGAAIVFFPKTRSVPVQPIQGRIESPATASEPKANESPAKEAPKEVAVNAQSSDAKPVDAPAAVQDASTVLPRKRDAAAVASGEAATTAPNPKSAAKPDDQAERAASKSAEPERPATKSNVGSTDTVAAKPAGPSPSIESGAKADQTATDAKKDPKRAASKSGDKDANGNKKDEKKGGLLRVFKKIFGKG